MTPEIGKPEIGMQGIWTHLLQDVGPAHHQAFAATDGDDPEWANWYAAWLLERMPGEAPKVSEPELAGLLTAAADAYRAAEPPEGWPEFYARFLVNRLNIPEGPD